MLPRPVIVAILVLCVAVPWLASAHRHCDAWAPRSSRQDEVAFLPTGDFIRGAALGYDALLADVFWVRATTLFGARFGGEDQQWYTWLYHMIDLATDLDPDFRAAYKYGGTMLRVNGVFVDQSSMIFQKGMRALPDDWYFPFGIAMNFYLYNQDPALAADYLEKAVKTGNGPFYLRNLTASMLGDSDRLETALVFLQEERKAVRDEKARVAVDIKILEVRYQIGQKNADRVLAEFRRTHGRLPTEPSGVVSAGLELPPDPLGGVWVWDTTEQAELGDVRSSRYCEVFVPLAKNSGLGQLSIWGCR
jgi:hypothetical protein